MMSLEKERRKGNEKESDRSIIDSQYAGCGSSGGDSGGESKEAGKQGKEASLRFIDVNPSPERQKYYEGVFQKFEEETGISVAYESVPWDDAADKLTVLGTSGQLPDVITTHPSWLGQFTEADWIMPVDDYVEEHGDEFVEAVKNINWAQEKEKYGHVYSIPDGFMVKGIFYRKDWVEEIGYEIPTGKDWTYDAYLKRKNVMEIRSVEQEGHLIHCSHICRHLQADIHMTRRETSC